MTASLCRDPYCTSYHRASHPLGGGSQRVVRSRSAAAAAAFQVRLPAGVPHAPAAWRALIAHRGRGRRRHTALWAGHPLYPYGFMLPNDPPPHLQLGVGQRALRQALRDV